MDETLDIEQDAPSVDTQQSLDSYMAKYTSEDNASFNDMLDTSNRHKRQMYAWAWNNNRIPTKREIEYHKQLAIEVEYPDEALAIQKRLPAVASWSHKPMNDLMYAPQAIESETGHKSEKVIHRKNTSFTPHQDTHLHPSVPPSPSFSTIQNAIHNADIDDDEPQVRGYTFVNPEPTPLLNKPSQFRIAETPKRDALAHRMADRARKSVSGTPARANTDALKMRSFTSSPNIRKTMISDAGKRLLERATRATPRSGTSTLRNEFIPTPTLKKPAG